MGLTQFCGWELGSEQEAYASSGTFEFSTSVKRTGAYALRTNPTSTGVGYCSISGFSTSSTGYGKQNSSMNIATSRTHFWFRYATKPASGSEVIAWWSDGTNHKASIRLTSDGTIAAYAQSTEDLQGTSTQVLSADTWYHLQVSVTGSGLQAWINQVSFVSASSLNNGSALYWVAFGKYIDRNGQSIDCYYDDIVITSGEYVPMTMGVTKLSPNGDGATTAWTIGSGSGSDWENVDEIPGAGTDSSYLLSTGVVDDESQFTLTDTATAGIPSTDLVWGIKELFDINSDHPSSSCSYCGKLYTHDTAYIPSITTWYSAANDRCYRHVVQSTNNPYTHEQWTLAELDAVKLAVVEKETTEKTRLYNCHLMVMHYPPRPLICAAGFEVNSTAEVRGTNTSGATVSVVDTPTRNSDYAFDTNITSGTGYGYASIGWIDPEYGRFYGMLSTGHTYYISFDIYITTLPASNSEPILGLYNDTGSMKVELRVYSDGALGFWTTTPSLVEATSSGVVSAGAWYRIDMMYGLCGGEPTAASRYILRVDGTEYLNNTTSATGSALACGLTYFGKTTNRNGNVVRYTFDNVVISETGFHPTNSRIVRMDPNADSATYDTWTVSGAGDSWEHLDEVGVIGSDTTYVVSTDTVNDAYAVGFESAASAGISGTIHVVWPSTAVVYNTTAAGLFKHRLRSGTTNLDSPAYISSNSTNIHSVGSLHTVDPATGAAWTTSGLDGVEAGMVEQHDTYKTRNYKQFLMVLFSPQDALNLVVGTILKEVIL